jgi:hypothetical protein
MNRRDFETLLLTLESTPALLTRAAASLGPDQERTRPPQGGFSFVENVWHLADLEREGYAVRIRRLLEEDEPILQNFDGDRLARERNYQERDAERGILAFSRARARNVEALRHLGASEWKRAGSQEGVGRVTLADLPRMMAEHDRSHAEEIASLLASLRSGSVRGGAIRGEGPCRPHPKSAVA